MFYCWSRIIKLHQRNFCVVWKQSHDTKNSDGSARMTFPPSYILAFLSFFCFYIFHRIYLSVASRPRYVHYGWLACPQTLFSHSTCSILFSSFHVCFQTSAPVPVQMAISNPNCPPSLFPSHWTTSMRKSHRTQNHQRNYRERHNKIKVKHAAVDLSFFYCYLLLWMKFFYVLM